MSDEVEKFLGVATEESIQQMRDGEEKASHLSEVKDFVARATQVRACVWQGAEKDPDTGAEPGNLIVYHPDDRIEVLTVERFNALYQEPTPMSLGPVKMAVGEQRLVGKRMKFEGTPDEVIQAQHEYCQANPTHMFVDEKVIRMTPIIICSMVLIDRIGRESDDRYQRELQLQAKVRKEMETQEAEDLRRRPTLVAQAEKLVAEAKARRDEEMKLMKADAEIGRSCRKNHKKGGKK